MRVSRFWACIFFIIYCFLCQLAPTCLSFRFTLENRIISHQTDVKSIFWMLRQLFVGVFCFRRVLDGVLQGSTGILVQRHLAKGKLFFQKLICLIGHLNFIDPVA